MSEAKQVGSEEGNGTMITHYGLFWSERAVFWGRPNNPGKLLGQGRQLPGTHGAPTSEEDFRNFVGLFCLYSDNKLLYIEQTNESNLFDYLKYHRRRGSMAGRWNRFSWFGRKAGQEQASIKDDLKQLEEITIAIINPVFSKRSAETLTGALQMFQVPHEEAEGDLDMKLSRITEQINSIKNSIKSN